MIWKLFIFCLTVFRIKPKHFTNLAEQIQEILPFEDSKLYFIPRILIKDQLGKIIDQINAKGLLCKAYLAYRHELIDAGVIVKNKKRTFNNGKKNTGRLMNIKIYKLHFQHK